MKNILTLAKINFKSIGVVLTACALTLVFSGNSVANSKSSYLDAVYSSYAISIGTFGHTALINFCQTNATDVVRFKKSYDGWLKRNHEVMTKAAKIASLNVEHVRELIDNKNDKVIAGIKSKMDTAFFVRNDANCDTWNRVLDSRVMDLDRGLFKEHYKRVIATEL